MSFLTRLSARAARFPSTVPVVMPKGLVARQPVPVARAEEPAEEQETLSPARPAARRQETDEPQEEASRQETEEEPEAQRQAQEEGEEEVAPLRRQEEEGAEEEPVAPLRRQEKEEEEEVAPLRRQEQEEEEEEALAPLRRQEEEEEAQPMRAIARQEEVPLEETGETSSPRSQFELEPKAEPASPELVEAEEPLNAQALHRDMAPGYSLPQPAPAAPGVAAGNPPANHPSGRSQSSALPTDLFIPESPALTGFHTPGTGPELSRPDVVIDQLDVVIHEPAPAPGSQASRIDRGRAFRARYLRRL